MSAQGAANATRTVPTLSLRCERIVHALVMESLPRVTEHSQQNVSNVRRRFRIVGVERCFQTLLACSTPSTVLAPGLLALVFSVLMRVSNHFPFRHFEEYTSFSLPLLFHVLLSLLSSLFTLLLCLLLSPLSFLSSFFFLSLSFSLLFPLCFLSVFSLSSGLPRGFGRDDSSAVVCVGFVRDRTRWPSQCMEWCRRSLETLVGQSMLFTPSPPVAGSLGFPTTASSNEESEGPPGEENHPLLDGAYNHSIALVLLPMLGEQELLCISETCHFALLVPPIERSFVMQQDAENTLARPLSLFLSFSLLLSLC